MGGARTVLGGLEVVVVVVLLLLLAVVVVVAAVVVVVVALTSSISDNPSSSTLRFGGFAVVLDVAQLAWLTRAMCCASAGSSPTAISSLPSSSLKSSAKRLMLLNVVVEGGSG